MKSCLVQWESPHSGVAERKTRTGGGGGNRPCRGP
jgi:hypothetical protein